MKVIFSEGLGDLDIAETKKCSVCKTEKNIDQFYVQNVKNKKGEVRQYRVAECKECGIKRTRKWQQENYEKYIVKKRIADLRLGETPERKKAYRENAKRRKENGEHEKWLKNNPDKVKEYSNKRYKKNHKITKNEWDACRLYFNYRCAYCDKTWEENYEETGKDLHKEHYDEQGSLYLDNCIPACRSCNSVKWKHDAEDWYNENNSDYTEDRKNKIIKWLNEDSRKYMKKRNTYKE